MSDWLHTVPRLLASSAALYALAAVALFAVALVAHVVWWRRKLTLELPYATVETLECDDGSRIGLRRIASTDRSSRAPVLLVHGVASNHRNQDGDERHSLARYLADQGRDVWLVTLRSGMHLGLRLGRKTCFASMARFDLPLAVRTVLERTGATHLDYVGFSMGGMLLYATIGRGIPQTSIRRAVFVGAPGQIAAPVYVPRFLARIPRWIVPTLRLRMLSLMFAFLSEWFATPLHRAILNPRNMTRGMTRRAMANCIEDVAGPLHADFIRWASDRGTIRLEGKPILEGLERVQVPALFLAGDADWIAPPRTVRRAFEAWGSADKTFLLVGRDVGSDVRYGHGDLALGTGASRDLFGLIATFLGAP